MVKGIPPPDGGEPKKIPPGDVPKQIETGISKTYTAAKAPGFQKWLEIWFGGNVSPKTVSAFEQGVMQSIQNSIKQSKKESEKVQREVRKRIEGG